jgi:hypothetical protein
MLAEPCLLCGHPGPSETAHWPYARARHSKAEVTLLPVVPLCHDCHTAAHWAKQEIVERLIALVPAYWKRQGLWELYGERFETWLSKRRYIEETRANSRNYAIMK